jgi:hypothetical protein
MTPDLMAATGDRHRGDERVSFGHDPETPEGSPARLLESALPIGQGAIDEKTIGEKPPDQAEIGLPGLRRRQRGVQRSGRLGIEAEEDHAGGGAIDTMDPVDPSPQLPPEATHENVTIGRQRAAVHEETRGFGHDDEATILI